MVGHDEIRIPLAGRFKQGHIGGNSGDDAGHPIPFTLHLKTVHAGIRIIGNPKIVVHKGGYLHEGDAAGAGIMRICHENKCSGKK